MMRLGCLGVVAFVVLVAVCGSLFEAAPETVKGLVVSGGMLLLVIALALLVWGLFREPPGEANPSVFRGQPGGTVEGEYHDEPVGYVPDKTERSITYAGQRWLAIDDRLDVLTGRDMPTIIRVEGQRALPEPKATISDTIRSAERARRG